MLFPKLTKRRRVISGYEFDAEMLKNLWRANKVSSHHYLNIVCTEDRTGRYTNLSTNIALLSWMEGVPIPEASYEIEKEIEYIYAHQFITAETYSEYEEAYHTVRMHDFVCHATAVNNPKRYRPLDLDDVIVKLDDAPEWANYLTLRLRFTSTSSTIPKVLIYLYTSGYFLDVVNMVEEKDWALAEPDTLNILQYLKDPYGVPLLKDERKSIVRWAKAVSFTTSPHKGCSLEEQALASAFKVLTLLGEPEEAAKILRQETAIGRAMGSDWSLKYNLMSHQQQMKCFDDEALKALEKE